MMTDKIMIDGIDVSRCKFLSPTKQCKIQQVFQRNEIVGVIEKPYGKHLECELCTANCDYKQLIRKTAECNELSEGLEDLDEELQRTQNQYNAVVEQNKSLQQQFKRKEEECEKWKSYYDLYRQDQTLLKKIQGIINSHPKYGVELTETGIIDKDERISYLEIDEQIKLIFTEYEAELQAEQQKVKELEKLLKVRMEDLCDACGAGSLYPMPCQKYKQALEEIKGIAEKLLKCVNDDFEDSIGHEILQKCEVLND